MRKIYLLSTLVLTAFFGKSSFAQDFSNKGKEFWLAYCYHVGMVNGGGTPAMTLYLTSDVTTTYNVEIYGVTSLASGTINANQVIPVNIPNSYFISTNGLTTGRTIRVTAVKPIVVYSFITRSQASAATLCLPTNVLGKEYYSSSFTQIANELNASSYITIIAVEDNTSVEITPTAPTTGGWAANSTNTVTLNKGEIYQVLGTTLGNNGVDLSGSKIRSVASASGGCKRIAVFSGTGKIAIGTPPAPPAFPGTCSGGSADNLYQQLYPVASWGKKFLTIPSSGRPYNLYRVMRSDPLSNVYVNGALIPAASFTNNYFQFYNNLSNLVESDIPISVAQYFPSANCPSNLPPPNDTYDPDMIVLNPVEQNINKVTLVSSPLTVAGTHHHHLHVIMRNGGTG
ncbi:MAG TPA: IgGFc-binding protein, partial [Chitinophagaceae bacterium]|nr:IgGFc-binding protein [Chitinophagaceae bacterium]